MKWIERARLRFKRGAIGWALRRKAPDRISLSDQEAMRTYNFFSVFVVENGEGRFLVDALSDPGVVGLWFDPSALSGERGREASMGNASLQRYDITITHYLRETISEYTSPLAFLISQFVGTPWLFLARARIGGFFYKQKRLVRSDRIKVLEYILERTAADRDFAASEWTVMNDFYGPRWIQHPDNMNLLGYYRLVLDSLAATEDLVRRDNSYRVGPLALGTLSDHYVEERRHRRNWWLQAWIVGFTFVLVAAAVVQAYFTAFPPPR